MSDAKRTGTPDIYISNAAGGGAPDLTPEAPRWTPSRADRPSSGIPRASEPSAGHGHRQESPCPPVFGPAHCRSPLQAVPPSTKRNGRAGGATGRSGSKSPGARAWINRSRDPALVPRRLRRERLPLACVRGRHDGGVSRMPGGAIAEPHDRIVLSGGHGRDPGQGSRARRTSEDPATTKMIAATTGRGATPTSSSSGGSATMTAAGQRRRHAVAGTPVDARTR